jgi:hypothetical protein
VPANIGDRVRRTHRAKGELETPSHSVALAGQHSEPLEESEQIALSNLRRACNHRQTREQPRAFDGCDMQPRRSGFVASPNHRH